MQELNFDLDDILSDKLMPLTLMQSKDFKPNFFNMSQKPLDVVEFYDASLDQAMSSMGFHRTMINNFLCSKFVAEKILDEIRPSSRLGVAKAQNSQQRFNHSLFFDLGDTKSHMLFDEGSQEYKNWLQKWVEFDDFVE